MESSTDCGGGAEIRRQIERQPGGVQVREFGEKERRWWVSKKGARLVPLELGREWGDEVVARAVQRKETTPTGGSRPSVRKKRGRRGGSG
jgi:hypothetical protein